MSRIPLDGLQLSRVINATEQKIVQVSFRQVHLGQPWSCPLPCVPQAFCQTRSWPSTAVGGLTSDKGVCFVASSHEPVSPVRA